MIRRLFIFAAFIFVIVFGVRNAHAKIPVLSNLDALAEIGVRPWQSDESLGVGLAELTPNQAKYLSYINHAKYRRCAGFEVVDARPSDASSLTPNPLLANLKAVVEEELAYRQNQFLLAPSDVLFSETIQEAVHLIDPIRLELDTGWLSSYKTRYHRSPTKNVHVEDLKERLLDLTEDHPWPIDIQLIEHERTQQKSVHLKIEGSEHPEEIVALGGHLDSITFWRGKIAPGADDNASGSAALLEALRVLLQQENVPKRSIEFFWYAGEESGLLGSGEIAETYAQEERDIIGVLQLDMTAFPGTDKNTFAFIADYTSSWLTQYLADLNEVYIGAKALRSKCGYACSDHASWFRQGFPAAFPHEAKAADNNDRIHTTDDTMEGLDFEHSAIFARLALAYAMDLANSTARSPIED